jgi:RHS repeat-associated protein
VDYNATQYWSDVINVIPGDETEVPLALEQLALDLTNDPSPVRFGGKPPVFRPARIQVASIGSLAGILLQGFVGQVTEEKVYYFINDHLGTPRKMVNENGVVAWSTDYQPFGEAFLSTEAVANNFRFPGQYYDRETGLHYNYHRYYDPHIGRYLTPDPIGLAGGINLFIYVENNPTNLIDAFGLYCKIVFGDPYAGGDPIRQWETEKRVGYYEAVGKWLLVEILLARVKLPIPNVGRYEYTVHHIIWQLFREYVDYWEICYDECTDEETSRKYIGRGETGKTQRLIAKQWDELRYLK